MTNKKNKRVKGTYVVEVYHGYMTIVKEPNIETARRNALREHGTRNVGNVRPATSEDIGHFIGMGGAYNET